MMKIFLFYKTNISPFFNLFFYINILQQFHYLYIFLKKLLFLQENKIKAFLSKIGIFWVEKR